MEYDIVIATRNRLPALRISLPLMLSQEKLPRNLIMVDASDNHVETKVESERIITQAGKDISLQILQSKAGSSYQRNFGLRSVKSPVVFFPDDDALWYPGLTERVMRVYERDREEIIGAACPCEASEPPPQFGSQSKEKSDRKSHFYLREVMSRFINIFERTFFMDPVYVEGFSRLENRTVPSWLGEESAVPFGPMTGFQMSFRTDVIRKTGFDENLGRYSLMEDRDASLYVLQERLIVCCEKALVYHFKMPGKRTDDYEWGLINMLNRAYVVCKHAPPGSPARNCLRRYSLYRFLVYLLRIASQDGRSRIRGAWDGISCFDELLAAPCEQVTERYLHLMERCITGQ